MRTTCPKCGAAFEVSAVADRPGHFRVSQDDDLLQRCGTIRTELIQLGHTDMTCIDQVREGERVFRRSLKAR